MKYEIKYKTYFNGWKEVNENQAYEIALNMLLHAGNINIEKINKRFENIKFTEEDLFRWNTKKSVNT